MTVKRLSKNWLISIPAYVVRSFGKFGHLWSDHRVTSWLLEFENRALTPQGYSTHSYFYFIWLIRSKQILFFERSKMNGSSAASWGGWLYFFSRPLLFLLLNDRLCRDHLSKNWPNAYVSRLNLMKKMVWKTWHGKLVGHQLTQHARLPEVWQSMLAHCTGTTSTTMSLRLHQRSWSDLMCLTNISVCWTPLLVMGEKVVRPKKLCRWIHDPLLVSFGRMEKLGKLF